MPQFTQERAGGSRQAGEGARVFDEASYWAPAQARFTEVDFLLRRG